MKEQLESLGYTNVQAIETQNGIGYVGVKNGGSIVIPPNCQDCSGLSMLVCGQGGTGNGIYYNNYSTTDKTTGDSLTGPNLLANAKNGNFPSNPVVIAPNDLYPGFAQSHYRADPNQDLGANLLNDAYTLLENNGAKITNVGVQGFSNGGPGSMLALGGFLELHPNKKFDTKIVLCDTYNVEEIVSLYDKPRLNGVEQGKVAAMDALINNGTQIYSLNWTSPRIYNNHATNVAACSQLITDKGFNFYYTKSSREAHAAYMTDFFNGNGLNFLSGVGDLKLDEKYYSGFFSLDAHGNEIVANITRPLIYTSILIDAISQYGYLSQLQPLTINSSKVSSDTEYVLSEMNRLRTMISGSQFLKSNTIQEFTNSAGIPGCIATYINTYYSIMGELMDSLAQESEKIVSIATTIDDMNTALTERANEISDDVSQAAAAATTAITTTILTDQTENSINDTSDINTPSDNQIPSEGQPQETSTQEQNVESSSEEQTQESVEKTPTEEPVLEEHTEQTQENSTDEQVEETSNEETQSEEETVTEEQSQPEETTTEEENNEELTQNQNNTPSSANQTTDTSSQPDESNNEQSENSQSEETSIEEENTESSNEEQNNTTTTVPPTNNTDQKDHSTEEKNNEQSNDTQSEESQNNEQSEETPNEDKTDDSSNKKPNKNPSPSKPSPGGPTNNKITELIEVRDDGSKFKFYRSGDKIVDLKCVYEFSSFDEANLNIENIREAFKDFDFIDRIEVEGNNVIITYKEDSYLDMSYQDIITKFFKEEYLWKPYI